MKLTVHEILGVAFEHEINQVSTTFYGETEDGVSIKCVTFMRNIWQGHTYEGTLRTDKNGITIFKREWSKNE